MQRAAAGDRDRRHLTSSSSSRSAWSTPFRRHRLTGDRRQAGPPTLADAGDDQALPLARVRRARAALLAAAIADPVMAHGQASNRRDSAPASPGPGFSTRRDPGPAVGSVEIANHGPGTGLNAGGRR